MTSGPETGSGEAREAVDAPEPDAERESGTEPGVGAEAPATAPDGGAADGADGAGREGASVREADGVVGAGEAAGADARDDVAAEGDGRGAPDENGPAEPTLEERLAAAEALADEHWNGRLRLQAELENQRKRALRDVQNARKFGLEPLLNDLLPVVDSLEMGLQASAADNATVESIREGVELTQKMLAGALEKHGIAEVSPVGEKFDPEFHQAMSMQAVEGAAPNTVVQVLQKGYTLNDRLLRPALVMVAK